MGIFEVEDLAVKPYPIPKKVLGFGGAMPLSFKIYSFLCEVYCIIISVLQSLRVYTERFDHRNYIVKDTV